jgi:GNAT superfamily N-acetyltransferase
MARFEIHRAEVQQAAAIAFLLRAAFDAYRPRYTDAAFDATVLDEVRVRTRLQEGPVWVAFDQRSAVGTVSAVQTIKGVYVRGMAVLPSARGRGIGSALLNLVERYAIANRAPRLFLSTTPFLLEAIALYGRCGFVRCPDPPHALHSTPLFTMEKALTCAATGSQKPLKT